MLASSYFSKYLFASRIRDWLTETAQCLQHDVKPLMMQSGFNEAHRQGFRFNPADEADQCLSLIYFTRQGVLL
jgi:hypothetical protein